MSYPIFRLAHAAISLLALGVMTTFVFWLQTGRSGTKAERVFAARGVRALARVATWLYVTTLITGVGLAHMSGISLLTPWLTLSLLFLVEVLAMLGIASARLRALIRAAEASSETTPEILRLGDQAFLFATVGTLSGFVVLGLMVLKPAF